MTDANVQDVEAVEEEGYSYLALSEQDRNNILVEHIKQLEVEIAKMEIQRAEFNLMGLDPRQLDENIEQYRARVTEVAHVFREWIIT